MISEIFLPGLSTLAMGNAIPTQPSVLARCELYVYDVREIDAGIIKHRNPTVKFFK
jgi:hypothetical protein